MEDALRQYHTMHRQLQIVQNSLISGQVTLARQVLSNVLLLWPSK